MQLKKVNLIVHMHIPYCLCDHPRKRNCCVSQPNPHSPQTHTVINKSNLCRLCCFRVARSMEITSPNDAVANIYIHICLYVEWCCNTSHSDAHRFSSMYNMQLQYSRGFSIVIMRRIDLTIRLAHKPLTHSYILARATLHHPAHFTTPSRTYTWMLYI